MIKYNALGLKNRYDVLKKFQVNLQQGFKISNPGTFLCCKELHQCNCCGLIYAVELPKSEELNKYYSNGFCYDQIADPFNPGQ